MFTIKLFSSLETLSSVVHFKHFVEIAHLQLVMDLLQCGVSALNSVSAWRCDSVKAREEVSGFLWLINDDQCSSSQKH